MITRLYPLFIHIASVACLSAATFVGEDGNWHDPDNWDTGLVPGATTDVIIPPGVAIRMEQVAGPLSVQVRDLSIGETGILSLGEGVNFRYRKMTLDGGMFVCTSAETAGDEIESPVGATGSLIRLNPTSNDSRAIKIAANNPAKMTLAFGLAGTMRAAPGNTGAGYYANLIADEVELADRLVIELLHDFVPAAGDQFLLIEARTTLTGRFDGLPEGAAVARCGALELRISYAGGDGNDVVLTAVASPPPPEAPLPDLAVFTDAPGSATVFFDPPVIPDLTGGGVSYSFDPPSGATFPIGTTTVTATLRDPAGPPIIRTFNITVSNPPLRLDRVGDELHVIAPPGFLAESSETLEAGDWTPFGTTDTLLTLPLVPPGPMPLPKQMFIQLKPKKDSFGTTDLMMAEMDSVRYVSTGSFVDWRESRLPDGTVHYPAKTGILLRQVDDLDETGMATLLAQGSTHEWSGVGTLPFTFWMHNKPFNQFCVTRSGLLTFSTAVAGSNQPLTILEPAEDDDVDFTTAPALPNPELPDYTIACFHRPMDTPFSDWTVTARTYGPKGSRQVWIIFGHHVYGQGFINATYRHALVLEEGRNRVLMVDMAGTKREGLVCGIQKNADLALQLPAGNRVETLGNGTDYQDNDYWIFTPYPRYTIRSGVGHANYDPLDKVIHDFLANNNVPGVSVSIGRDRGGRMLYNKAFGYANVEKNIPMTPQHRNPIGSCSKVFTAAGIFKLIQLRILDPADFTQPILDTPVFEHSRLLGIPSMTQAIADGVANNTHTPELATGLYSITTRHLLTHTSSLAGNSNDLAAANAYQSGNYSAVTRENLIQWFLANVPRLSIAGPGDDPPLFPVAGSRFNYSNEALAMAGFLIENATGQDYDQWMNQNVLHPMGIHSMIKASDYESADPRDSYRYCRYEGGAPHVRSLFNANTNRWNIRLPRNYGSSKIYTPQGGWIATTEDLMRFMFGFTPDSTPERPNVLTELLRAEMLSRPWGDVPNLNPPGTTSPAHGWFMVPTNGRSLEHNGDLPYGGSAFMASYLRDLRAPDADPYYHTGSIYIALTSNSSGLGGRLTTLGFQLMQLVRSLPMPPPGYDLMAD